MKHKLFSIHRCLYFSRWSKKGYSVFAGLGCEVRISRLATHMYENVLLKAVRNGVIVNDDQEAEVPSEALYLQQCLLFVSRWAGKVCPDILGYVFQKRRGIYC